MLAQLLQSTTTIKVLIELITLCYALNTHNMRIEERVHQKMPSCFLPLQHHISWLLGISWQQSCQMPCSQYEVCIKLVISSYKNMVSALNFTCILSSLGLSPSWGTLFTDGASLHSGLQISTSWGKPCDGLALHSVEVKILLVASR